MKFQLCAPSTEGLRRFCIGLSLLLSLVGSATASNLLPNNGTFQTSPSCQTASLNGNVEPQDVLPCGWILNGPASVSGTTVVAPTVYGLADPASSAQYLAFWGGNGGQDCLETAIPTVAGDLYQVSFWAAVVGPQVDSGFLTFEWDVNSPHGECSQPSAGTPCAIGNPGDQLLYNSYFNWAVPPNFAVVTDEPFKQFTYTVQADITGNTDIYFHGSDYVSGHSSSAVLVADASVTQQNPIPEPAGLLLVASGLVLLGCFRSRFRITGR